MPTPQKEQIIQEMSDKFSRATSIFLADFTGLDVNTTVNLRKNFRTAQVEYKVVKNTLARRSLEKAGIKGLEEFVVGVNSYIISYDDPTKPIKVVENLKKELEDHFKLKAAYFEGQVVGPDQVEALAKLPSREELYSMLVGMLQSPIAKLMYALQSKFQELIGVLKALEDKKK